MDNRQLGKKSRNPYLLFLRDYRSENGNLKQTDVVKFGAQKWNNLSAEIKLEYYKMSRGNGTKSKRSQFPSYESLGWILIVACLFYLIIGDWKIKWNTWNLIEFSFIHLELEKLMMSNFFLFAVNMRINIHRIEEL